MKTNIAYRDYRWPDGVTLSVGEGTLIMGILNITPDSFSDGGRYTAVEDAVEQARQMAEAGADLIDIGGESTRPGSTPVPLQEELNRILPVIAAIREALPKLPLSIDTYKAETARAALAAGAHIINDVWGLKYDGKMAAVASEYGCPVIISHNRKARDYESLVPDVLADLQESIALGREAGITDDNIWLDPGIGFAKDMDDNLHMMGSLDQLTALGYPVLLGTSRKRFIQQALDLPAGEVVMGTAATVVAGIMQGCQLVRVHDVAAIRQAARMTDRIVYRYREDR